MDDTATQPDPNDTDGSADPIDVEAAEIDAREPDAAEQIAELVDDAEALGRDIADPAEVDVQTPDVTTPETTRSDG